MRCGNVCVCLFTHVHSDVQIESDLSCPGGKARIIHKESDIITAFAINKVQFLHSHALRTLSLFEIVRAACSTYSNAERFIFQRMAHATSQLKAKQRIVV